MTKERKLQKIITARFHSSYIIVSRMWVEIIGRFRLLKRTAAGRLRLTCTHSQVW